MPIIAGNTITKTPGSLATSRRAPDARYTGLGLAGASLAEAARKPDLLIRRNHDLLKQRLGDIDQKGKLLQGAVKGIQDAFQIWGRAQERYDERWATQQATEYARLLQESFIGTAEAPGIRESVVQIGKDGPENGAAQKLAERQQELYDEMTRDADVDSYARRVFDEKVARTNDHFGAEANSIDRANLIRQNKLIDAAELAQRESEALASSPEMFNESAWRAGMLHAKNSLGIPADFVRTLDGAAFDWDGVPGIAEDGTPDIAFPDDETVFGEDGVAVGVEGRSRTAFMALARAKHDELVAKRMNDSVSRFVEDEDPGAAAAARQEAQDFALLFADEGNRKEAESKLKKADDPRKRNVEKWTARDNAQARDLYADAFLHPDAHLNVEDEIGALRYAEAKRLDAIRADAYHAAQNEALGVASMRIGEAVQSMTEGGMSMEDILGKSDEIRKIIDSVQFPEARSRLEKYWGYGPAAMRKALNAGEKPWTRSLTMLMLDVGVPGEDANGNETVIAWKSNADKVDWLRGECEAGRISAETYYAGIQKLRTAAEKTDDSARIVKTMEALGIPVTKILRDAKGGDFRLNEGLALGNEAFTSGVTSYSTTVQNRSLEGSETRTTPYTMSYDFLQKAYDYARTVQNDLESGVVKGGTLEQELRDFVQKDVEYKKLTEAQLVSAVTKRMEAWRAGVGGNIAGNVFFGRADASAAESDFFQDDGQENQ